MATRTGTPSEQRSPDRPFWRRPGFWLVVGALVLYSVNLTYGGCGSDDRTFRHLPTALMRHGKVTMEPYAHTFVRPDGSLHYSVVEHEGHLVSIYPPAMGFIALPIFAIPALVSTEIPTLLLGKLTAGILSALSVGLVYASARRLGLGTRSGLMVGGLYGFATPVWSVASHALCQHPGSTLAVAAALYCTVRALDRPAGWVALAAFSAGAGVAIRPQVAVAAAPLLVLLFVRFPQERLSMLAAGAAPVLPALAYNLIAAGNIQGGYGLAAERYPHLHFQGDLLEGVGGLLVSPGKGLFVFAPFTLFAVAGAVRAIRRRQWLYIACAAGFLGTLLLFGRLSTWWGGHTFGPRYLVETMPLVAALLVPLFRPPSVFASRTLVAWVFVLLATASVFVQVVGAFAYPCSWDNVPDERKERNWDWTDTPVSRCLSEGFRVNRGLLRPSDGLEAGG